MSESQTNSAATPLSPSHPTLAVTAETLERLIAEAQYQQHSYGKVWQRFDLDSFSELVANIDRRGQDQDILLYQGMILEGWHRYLACIFTKTKPKVVEFKGTDLEAAERVHASGIRRQSTPEQRYASFDLLCEACPAFKKKYEQLKQQGSQQQQAGKPLSTDGQRVDVVKTKADAAGVSRSTAAKVEKVKKVKPEAVADIAAGRTSANKELKKIKTDDDQDSAKNAAEPPCRLDELTTMTQGFTTFLQNMDKLDWSKEDDKEWDKAGKAANKAILSIVNKAQEGFKNAQPQKATQRPEGPQKQQKAPSGEITIRKLKSLYGDHALHVLDDFLESLDREDSAMRTYKIVKPLPIKDEFNELQKKRYTSSLADLVADGFATLENLAGEVGGWYDNLSEGFQGSDKGSALDDARNTLESLSQPDVDEDLGALEVFYLPIPKVSSRASRRDDAVGRLQAVVDALSSSDSDEANALVDELENAISEAEGVEFPSMYG